MRDLIHIVETYLNEAGAGASRITKHIQSGRPFFIISAQRTHFSVAENNKRTQILKDNLSKIGGMSFIEVDGEYPENGGPMAKEKSFLVLPRSMNTNPVGFFRAAVKLMKIFDQESILFGDGTDVFLEFQNGEKYDLGSALTFDPSVIKTLGGSTNIKGKSFSFHKGDKPDADDISKVA